MSRRPLLPNEFQQMAGRAGRRGIDEQGHVVIPYSPFVTFHEALNIATGPLRPVESAFTMRYNSVLNLWEPPEGERVLTVMKSSLLQFQQNRRLRDLEDALEEEEERIEAIPVGCLIGYENGEELLDEYERLGRVLEEARRREKKAAQNLQYLEAQRLGIPWKRPERDTAEEGVPHTAAGVAGASGRERVGDLFGAGTGRGGGAVFAWWASMAQSWGRCCR